MILLSDEIRTWGNIATIHYTHPPRSVVMQIALAGRVDFSQTTPPDHAILRAVVFFMSFIAGGVETDLMAAPIFGASQFRADALTEVRAQVFAENAGAEAIVSQFSRHPGPASADTVDAAVTSLMVAFIRPVNGTIAYKHLVKVIAGGRQVSKQEAIDDALKNAAAFSIDVAQLQMKVTADAGLAVAARRFDQETGAFLSAALI